MRTRITLSLLIFLFLVLFLRLLHLQFIQGKQLRRLSHKNCIRLLPQEGIRGSIFDSNGKTLVDSYLSYDLTVLPDTKRNSDKILVDMSKILNVDINDLDRKLKNSDNISFTPLALAKNIDLKKAFALEELRPDLGNIFIQPSPLRAYPFGSLACHLIGYLGEIDRSRLTKLSDYGYKTKDIVGFGGVEEKYDYYLRQEEGGLSVEVDHRGRFTRVLGFKPPGSGKDIQLSLDLRLQELAEKNLGDRTGAVIIMDPYDGQIRAMVSQPGFNPAIFINKSGSSLRSLFKDPDAPLLNRAISGLYPAGSIFKLAVATAALETGKLNLSKTFICPGGIKIGNIEFSCWDSHNQQNLISAIKYSCNVFFYRTGLLTGAQNIYDYALKLGFSRPTGVDLPYEASGFVPSPLWKRFSKFKNWYDGDTLNLSIGQGDLLVTPLQVARMMAVFANRGTLVTPSVIKNMAGDESLVIKKRPINLNLKGSTIDSIREGLRKVVEEQGGTAHVLSDLPISVAAKTGTAQTGSGQPHGWFAGFLPFNKPRFVICVFLEHGGTGYAASLVAKQIITDMGREGLL